MSHAANIWTTQTPLWAQNISSSRKAQLIITAIVSGGIVAASILGFQSLYKQEQVRRIKSLAPCEGGEVPVKTVGQFEAVESLIGNAEKVRRKEISQATPCEFSASPQPVGRSRDDEKGEMFAARARRGDYDNDLILEQLARTRVFLKDEGLGKVRSAFVIVVGCGGVGSHAAAALARSGISILRLIDFDQVSLSSLNRHAVATLADVGTPKVSCMRKRLEQIVPWVQFDCRNELFSKDCAGDQLSPWNGIVPSYIIDAIDNIDSKVELLKYCHDNNLPVVSSMGAGCKSDPTKLFVGDISSSTEDPLSRATRRRLRALGVVTGINVVFSSEKLTSNKAQLLPLPEEEFQKGTVGDLGVLPDFRIRILPVLGTMPAMFGLCLANHIMLQLSEYPHEYLAMKSREKMYDGIQSSLQGFEERLARWAGEDANGLRLPIRQEDIGYLVEEVYKGKSIISSLSTRLALIRWKWPADHASLVVTDCPGQKSARLTLKDLVCMTKEEANRHEQEVLKGGKSPEEFYDPSIIKRVRHRMEEESLYEKYR